MSTKIELLNLKENETVVSPCLIVRGRVTGEQARNVSTIQVQHPQLPPLTFPVNAGHFRATIIVTPGVNRLIFITNTNASITTTCTYTPMLQNKPIHLCLLVAKDSPLKFDSPRSQIQKEGGNGIDLAVKKLRVAARLMQAYTNEQMVRNGFGQRTFNFVEEYTSDTLFRQGGQVRNTVKIFVVQVDKTVAEIRDPNVAQQNQSGTDRGALFSWAMDALKRYGAPFTDKASAPVQAACIYMDTHWDGKLILGHAALGGGTDDIKLAIFGSHGLYSWPTCMEDVVPYFTDETRASTTEVANDNNECGTHWECLTITLGAFMHEIGHSLGSPHQVSGVMLRDYTTLNRSFLTKEAFSVRTRSYGAQPPIKPEEECTWNRLDMLRFLYHPAFTREQDYLDPSFMRPGKNGKYTEPKASLYPLENNSLQLSSQTGIYLVEVYGDDLARGFLEFLPKSLGGAGPQKQVILSMDNLINLYPRDQRNKYKDHFKLKVLSVNAADSDFDDLPSMLKDRAIPLSPYGFGPRVVGIKSQLLGGTSRGNETGIVAFNSRDVVSVRVYHGGAVDGIRFYLRGTARGSGGGSGAPAIPPRTYLDTTSGTFSALPTDGPQRGNSLLFGKETTNFTDVVLRADEVLIGFNVRSGAWVDGIQLITNHGESNMFGNKTGGSKGELRPPSGHIILGVYGRVSKWVDAFGIIYGRP